METVWPGLLIKRSNKCPTYGQRVVGLQPVKNRGAPAWDRPQRMVRIPDNDIILEPIAFWKENRYVQAVIAFKLIT